MRNLKTKAAAAVVLAGGSASAFAEDWTAVTGALDLSGEITAIMAVVGVLAGFFVVRKGGRLLLSMIK